MKYLQIPTESLSCLPLHIQRIMKELSGSRKSISDEFLGENCFPLHFTPFRRVIIVIIIIIIIIIIYWVSLGVVV